MRVKAPNGQVFDLPDSVASGLLGMAEGGWSPYKEPAAPTAPEPAPEPEPEAPKRRRGRPRKS